MALGPPNGAETTTVAKKNPEKWLKKKRQIKLLLKKMAMLTMLEQMLTLNTVQACNLSSGKKYKYCHSNPVVTIQPGNYSELFRAESLCIVTVWSNK